MQLSKNSRCSIFPMLHIMFVPLHSLQSKHPIHNPPISHASINTITRLKVNFELELAQT